MKNCEKGRDLPIHLDKRLFIKILAYLCIVVANKDIELKGLEFKLRKIVTKNKKALKDQAKNLKNYVAKRNKVYSKLFQLMIIEYVKKLLN